jgi:Fe-Mn family superoxide dismutase
MKRNGKILFKNNLSVIGFLLLFTVLANCKTVKPIGDTEIKPSTYPTADGYVQNPLGYSYNALLPYADKQRVKEHYEQIHSKHITKLNQVVFAHESMMGKSLEELLQSVSQLPNDVKSEIRQHGGAHWNYTFFWKSITDKKNTQPSIELSNAINNKWGSLEKFGKAFTKAAKVKYGQCWVWLVNTKKGLKISVTQNNDNPLMDMAEVKGKPILAILMQQQTFALADTDGDGLDAFWDVVDWERASKLFAK